MKNIFIFIKKYCSFLFLFLLLVVSSKAQYDPVLKEADSLYSAKQYNAAAEKYLYVARLMPRYINPKSWYYNAACCYALLGDSGKAQLTLDSAIFVHHYKNFDQVLKDKDFTSLHETVYWTHLKNYFKEETAKLNDPENAKLITTDIHNFWKAYDWAMADTTNRNQIFTDLYFNRASPGLQDYYKMKIGSIPSFVRNQDKKPEFYKAIRKNTLAIDGMKNEIQGYLVQLKKLYNDAVFPDIYFVIGRWNSAGTASENGMLIGVDQQVKTADIPIHELNMWEKNNFQEAGYIPIIVTHELIHSQQMKMKEDTTLLCYAVLEGMADFMCELITGKQPSFRQHAFAKTRKKEIWEEFKKEMYLNKYRNWIANADQEREDRPADLGYYVGYEICKAYYDKAKDKKQAIKDFFQITDYALFLKESGYDALMAEWKDTANEDVKKKEIENHIRNSKTKDLKIKTQ